MSTGEAKLKITADASQATRELNKLDGAVSSAGASTNKLGGAAKELQPKIEKAATAVTGMSSVLGGMGAKAGAAFGAVSNLASAFVEGGPLLLGFALVTSGVAAVVSEINKFEKAQKDAVDAAKKFGQAFGTELKGKLDAAQASAMGVRQELEALALKAEFGFLAAEAGQMISARRGLSDAISEKGAAGRELSHRKEKVAEAQRLMKSEREGERSQGRIRIKAAKEALKQAEANLKLADETEKKRKSEVEDLKALIALRGALKKQQDEQLAAMEAAQLKERKRAKAAKARAKAQGGKSEDIDSSSAFLGRVQAETKAEGDRRRRQERDEAQAAEERMLDLDHSFDVMRRRRAKKDLAAAKKKHREEVRLAKKAEKKKLRAAKKAADEEARYRKAKQQEILDFVGNTVTASFDLTMSVIDAGIRGQWDAIGGMVAQYIKGIGTEIFGIGLKWMLEGTGMAIASGGLDPRSEALIGFGAGTMALGGSIAATGTIGGAVASLATSGGGSSGGGGRGGRSGPGVGGHGGGGAFASQGGGNVSINFSGGTFLGDPTERARNLRRDQLRASRTVFTPGG